MKNEGARAARHEQLNVRSDDGHAITVYYWNPANGAVRATAHILHGLAEHAARYRQFAEILTQHGFAVIAHNHRGHGADLTPDALGHFADDDGWEKVLDDVGEVHRHLRSRHANLPQLLVGHSMGSYIAQAFVMQNPRACDALVLSGSTHASRLQLYLGSLAARVEIWRRGRQFRSNALNAQAFGAFNKQFDPARTEFDWLSRDDAAVDRYIGDPACGFIPSAGLWRDLLGGMLKIGRKKSLQKVPAGLPILILGGSDDPVGGSRGMQRLLRAYSGSGHGNVSLNVYAGGRHEMLNEVNRQDVMQDIAEWASRALFHRQVSAP